MVVVSASTEHPSSDQRERLCHPSETHLGKALRLALGPWHGCSCPNSTHLLRTPLTHSLHSGLEVSWGQILFKMQTLRAGGTAPWVRSLPTCEILVVVPECGPCIKSRQSSLSSLGESREGQTGPWSSLASQSNQVSEVLAEGGGAEEMAQAANMRACLLTHNCDLALAG